MPFIHVKDPNVLIAENAEHPDATDTEEHSLAEAIILVPAIQEMDQTSIPFRIFLAGRRQGNKPAP